MINSEIAGPALPTCYPSTIFADQGESCALVIRFEDCLCTMRETKRQTTLLEIKRGTWRIKRRRKRLPSARITVGNQISPLALELKISRALTALRWRMGAAWFLRTLGRDPSLKVFILSDYPELIVQRKIASVMFNTQIVGSILEYEPRSGLYYRRFNMNCLMRRRFMDELYGVNKFEQIVYMGARADDLPNLTRSTGIYMGIHPHSTGPGQFVVRNFMEANSTLKSIRASRILPDI